MSFPGSVLGTNINSTESWKHAPGVPVLCGHTYSLYTHFCQRFRGDGAEYDGYEIEGGFYESFVK